MSYQGSRGFTEFFTDFKEGTNIGTGAAAGVSMFNSSDTSDTAFAINAGVIGGEGTAQAATTTTDNNMCELSHGAPLSWRSQLDCMMETRLQLNVITNVAFNVGFNDDDLENSNTLPVELATTTFTSNASTWAGFVYDVNATNDEIHVFTVDGDADTGAAIADLRMTGAAPVAATYGVYTVQLYRGASATAKGLAEWTAIPDEDNPNTQYRKRTGSSGLDATALSGATPLTAHIAFENRSATAHQCDVDYVLIRQRRPVDTNN